MTPSRIGPLEPIGKVGRAGRPTPVQCRIATGSRRRSTDLGVGSELADPR